jgi:hypothetical protein
MLRKVAAHLKPGGIFALQVGSQSYKAGSDAYRILPASSGHVFADDGRLRAWLIRWHSILTKKVDGKGRREPGIPPPTVAFAYLSPTKATVQTGLAWTVRTRPRDVQRFVMSPEK